MAISNIQLIRGASSNAPIIFQNKIPTSVSSQTPPNNIYPQDNMTGSGQNWLLQYPLDRGKYFMVFDIFNYRRRDLNTIGQMTRVDGINEIVMPLSETLVNQTQIQYDSHAKIGLPAGAAANILGPPLQDWWNGQGSFPTGKFAAAAGVGVVTSAVKSLAGNNPTAASAASGALPGIEALMGFSPNQFFTVLFVGPEYKRHRFSWQLSPRNFQEADELRKIIKTFKNRMSPDLYPGGFVWKFPKIFWISLYSNSKFMYKFKPAVLEAFSVNYTPGGRASFYRSKDDSDAGNNPPTGVTISAQFLELEYWIDGNINDSNDPHDVYTRTGEAQQEWESLKARWKEYIDNMEPGVAKDTLKSWYDQMFGAK
jgi:hypothetical protein